MSFFDSFSEEREEENLTVRELLTEMKDISEVIVDLAYASLLFDSNEIGDEVKHLESKMDVLNYEIRSRTMLASRTREDAIQLSGLLQIAESAAAISKAAGDIVGIREINPRNSPFLSFVFWKFWRLTIRARLSIIKIRKGADRANGWLLTSLSRYKK